MIITDNEIWKDIEGYEGLYQISNLGNVKSLHWHKERILKPETSKDGYLRVRLCQYGKMTAKLVHRLVAENFILNPDNLPQVNHIDEIKTNNVVENLEWCTQLYNVNYSQSKKVIQLDLNGNILKIWNSFSECSKSGFSAWNIHSCCIGKRKSHKGFIWRYCNDAD